MHLGTTLLSADHQRGIPNLMTGHHHHHASFYLLIVIERKSKRESQILHHVVLVFHLHNVWMDQKCDSTLSAVRFVLRHF